MSTPNLFMTYVSNTEVSAAFDSDLFDMQPCFVSPRYVAFEIAPNVLFAVWTGHDSSFDSNTLRTSKVGLMVKGPASRVDETFQLWKSKGVRVIKPPYDDVFGHTFLISDPDGNLIRVSPVD